MRPDMERVIINRPRRQASYSYANTRRAERQADPETLPFRERMTERYGYDRKEFNDRVGPLRRYLRKQVGRRWDDVFSEVAAVADERTIAGHHLRSQGSRGGHLFDTVEVSGVYRGYPPYRGRELYVDEGGLLAEDPDARRSWKSRPRSFADEFADDLIVVRRYSWDRELVLLREGLHWLLVERKMNGAWLPGFGRPAERDILTKRRWSRERGWSYWEGWHARSIRYLSKREKCLLGLR